MAPVLFVCALLSGQTTVIVVHGQSVAVGVNNSALSTVATGNNKMITGNTYRDVSGSCGDCVDVPPPAWPLIPLVEGGWINDVTGTESESPRHAIAGYFRQTSGIEPVVVTDAEGGRSYAELKRGTRPWTIFQRMVESLGARGSYDYAAVMIHGESNYSDSAATYKANILEWCSDTEAKLWASTRWHGRLTCYVSQPSGWTNSVFNLTTSGVPYGMLTAMRENDRRIVVVGPQYDLTYRDANHPDSASSRLLGARIGRAIAEGPASKPVYPLSVSRAGAVITVSIHAPTPPLVLDTTLVSNPGNYGFTYHCGSSPPAVSSVDCSAACSGTTCSCAITLASTPGGACQTDDVIRYAYTAAVPSAPGPTTGPRGNVRDSSGASNTWAGADMHRWMVHFEDTVPN